LLPLKGGESNSEGPLLMVGYCPYDSMTEDITSLYLFEVY